MGKVALQIKRTTVRNFRLEEIKPQKMTLLVRGENQLTNELRIKLLK
jgi:hypothetical protein